MGPSRAVSLHSFGNSCMIGERDTYRALIISATHAMLSPIGQFEYTTNCLSLIGHFDFILVSLVADWLL